MLKIVGLLLFSGQIVAIHLPLSYLKKYIVEGRGLRSAPARIVSHHIGIVIRISIHALALIIVLIIVLPAAVVWVLPVIILWAVVEIRVIVWRDI